MRCVTVAALAFAFLVAWPAQVREQVLVGTSKNPTVEPIVTEISLARIEATIRKLASFDTRGVQTPTSHFVPSRTVMTLVATGDRIETLARRLSTAPDRSCRISSRLLRFACNRDRFSQSRSGAVMG